MPKTRPEPEPFEPEWLQRSLDRHYAWGLVFMAVLIAGFPLYRLREPHLRADAIRSERTAYVRIGGDLFAHNCAECHGPRATGGTAPTLNSKQFLSATTDDQIVLLVSGGISGTSMPAWSIDYGGQLTNEQVRQVVTYLRSLAPHAPDVPNWREGKPSGSG